MHITIERARPDEAKDVLAFLAQVGAETDNLTFGEEGPPFSEEQERAYLESMMNCLQGAFFLAKRDGRILGCASYNGMASKRMGHRGSVSFAVLKSEWGKGVGGMLMEHILDFARNTAGAEVISLEVRCDNQRAIRLYEKYGFEKIGRFKGFFKIDGEYVDFDLMNLYL